MDEEFAAFAARVADDAARAHVELHEANTLIAALLDQPDLDVPVGWRARAERHLRGHA